MDFVRYKDAEDMLHQTGWSLEKALAVLEAEVEKLQRQKNKI